MEAVKNISGNDLEFPFEFKTYLFPKNGKVLVDKKLFAHLKTIVPLSFDFNPDVGKTEKLVMVKSKKTPSFVKPTREALEQVGDMSATRAGMQKRTFGQIDQTPPSGTTDSDGVSWYGEGEVIEQRGGGFN